MPEEPEHNPMLEEPDPEGAESQEPIEPLVTRRSTRGAHTPIWMKDFVLLNINKEIQFLVSDCVAYKHLSKSYQDFIASTSMLQEPTTYAEASKNPKWVETMKAEILALQSNNTWELSEFPKGKTAIGCRWIYKIKYKSSGEVESYKARLVAKEYSQKEGTYYKKKFSPMVKMVTIRTILDLVVARKCHIHQTDVYNASLNGDL